MIQGWVDECCDRGGQITLKAAHKSYRDWCESSGAIVLGRNAFGDQLEARGFKRGELSRNKQPIFAGLTLPVTPDPRYAE